MQVLARVIGNPFDFGGSVRTRKSKPFYISEYQFKELRAAGLVEEVTEPDAPKKPAGEQQSASQAGQASQQQTASESENGETRTRRRGRSSAQTPPSD